MPPVASLARFVTGRLLRLEAGDGEVVPWKEPRRRTDPFTIRFRLQDSTRFLRFRAADRKDLQPGEWILALIQPPDRPPKVPPAGSAALPDNVRPQTGRLRALVACGPAAEGDEAPPDTLEEAIWEAVRPYFKGEARGGLAPPSRRDLQVVARFTERAPFTLRRGDETMVWSRSPDPLVIRVEWADRTRFRPGEAVWLFGATTQDGDSLQATLAALAPQPYLNPIQKMRMDRRQESLRR